MFFDQVGAEPVVSGGYRRVGREYDFAGDTMNGLIKPQAFLLHAISNGFKDRESAVSLVEVKNARGDAHRPQGAEASDTEQQLLADSHARVAAIQTRGELHVLRSVPLDVGIQKKQITSTHVHAPDFCPDEPAARFDLYRNSLAVGSNRKLHRQMANIRLQVFFLLPATGVERLPEIALAVKQADANQGDAQVGRALNVIARQDPQPAGIFGNRFVQSELSREVRDRARPQHAGVARAPGPIGFEVFELCAAGRCVIDPAMKHQFACSALDLRERNFAQHGHRIVIKLPPAHWIQVAEQAGRIVVPGPPDIAGQRPKPFL